MNKQYTKRAQSTFYNYLCKEFAAGALEASSGAFCVAMNARPQTLARFSTLASVAPGTLAR